MPFISLSRTKTLARVAALDGMMTTACTRHLDLKIERFLRQHVTYMDDRSGHYKPTLDAFRQLQCPSFAYNCRLKMQSTRVPWQRLGSCVGAVVRVGTGV